MICEARFTGDDELVRTAQTKDREIRRSQFWSPFCRSGPFEDSSLDGHCNESGISIMLGIPR